MRSPALRQAVKSGSIALARANSPLTCALRACSALSDASRVPCSSALTRVGRHLLESRRIEVAMDISVQYRGAEIPHAQFHINELESRALLAG